MTQALFQITNLQCAYKEENGLPKLVLEIPALTIPKGKITMFLGQSGVGKSTILETLGLMNNTLRGGSSICFRPDGKEEYYLERLYREKKEKEIADIRNRHYSFIFQSTNLMPNFTAYENVYLSQMIQGVSLGVAEKNAERVMQEIGLGEIDRAKKAMELSGGQRQRLAFVRAVTPEFSVLFGDEPTGNLDEGNSEDLMHILRKEVTDKQRSAIIVTHDIDMALQFADVIMVLTLNDKRVGELQEQYIFHKQTTSNNIPSDFVWESSNSTIKSGELRGVIKELL